MAADLGSVKPRPWGKYSKTTVAEKTEKEKQAEAKKKKKEEKDTALLGEVSGYRLSLIHISEPTRR